MSLGRLWTDLQYQLKVQLKVSQTDACIVMAYTSKQHEEVTRYVILFVLKDKKICS